VAAGAVPAPHPATEDDDDDTREWMFISQAAVSLAAETTPGAMIGRTRLAIT
jgi:hypothetical protein